MAGLALGAFDGTTTTVVQPAAEPTGLEPVAAGGPMTIVAADGQEVEPISEQRLLVGVAETYDLILMLPPAGAWELRATAHDGSAHASVSLGAGGRHIAPAVPRPNIYRGMAGLGLREIFALTPQGAMGMPDGAVRAGAFDRPGMMHGHGSHGASGGEHAGHGPARNAAAPIAGVRLPFSDVEVARRALRGRG